MNYRFSDVLISLFFANKYKQDKIGKIQLQKLIYLADTISIIWKVLAPKHGHKTYKYGPYDKNIQNAVDVLAFRGFVDIVSFVILEKNVDVKYKISELGLKLYERIGSEPTIAKKIDFYKHISYEVDKRNWFDLKSMVYSEPSYISNKIDGYGFGFDYLSLLNNESLRILYDFEKMLKPGQKISKQNMVTIFFKLIDK